MPSSKHRSRDRSPHRSHDKSHKSRSKGSKRELSPHRSKSKDKSDKPLKSGSKHGSSEDLSISSHSRKGSKHRNKGETVPSNESKPRHKSNEDFSASKTVDMSGESKTMIMAKQDLGLTQQKSDHTSDISPKARRAREDAEAKNRARQAISRRGAEAQSTARRAVGPHRGPAARARLEARKNAENAAGARKSTPADLAARKTTLPDLEAKFLPPAPPPPSKSVAAASNDDALPIAAVAVNEEEDEVIFDQRVQDAVDRAMQNTPKTEAVAEDLEELNSRIAAENRRTRRNRICVLMIVLMIIGGGVAAIVLLGVKKETAADPVPIVYEPPSEEDCQAIREQKPVAGQVKLIKANFLIDIDVVFLKEENVDGNFTALVTTSQEKLVPELAGCTNETNQSNQTIQTNETINQTNETNQRSLEQVLDHTTAFHLRRKLQRTIPYPIANAIVSAQQKIGESCTADLPDPCRRATLKLELFLSEGGDSKQVFPMVREVFEIGKAQPLVGKLELSDDGYQEIRYVVQGNSDPSNESTSAPNGSPSSAPSDAPSSVSSIATPENSS